MMQMGDLDLAYFATYRLLMTPVYTLDSIYSNISCGSGAIEQTRNRRTVGWTFN